MKKLIFLIGLLTFLFIIDISFAMANPAAVYCLENNGILELRDSDLGQSTFCIFPDDSECEEWAYYRGECDKGENFP